MKNQALFSSKEKSKTLKCCLLQFLFGALRVKCIFAEQKEKKTSLVSACWITYWHRIKARRPSKYPLHQSLCFSILLGAPVAQWVKRWPTDLADRVRSSLEVKSSQP